MDMGACFLVSVLSIMLVNSTPKCICVLGPLSLEEVRGYIFNQEYDAV